MSSLAASLVAAKVPIDAAREELIRLFSIVPIIAFCALGGGFGFLALSRRFSAVRTCPSSWFVLFWHGICLIRRLEIWPQFKEEFHG